MQIRPFSDYGLKLPKKPAFVERLLRRFLADTFGKWAINVDGGLEISKKDPDTINIRMDASASVIHPWKVLSASRSTISIVPGWITTKMYYTEFVQTVRYRARPTLAAGQMAVNITGINNGYVVLRTSFDAGSGNAISPQNWTLRTIGIPQEIGLIRTVTGTDGRNALIDIPVAKITGGALDAQLISNNLYIQSRMNAVYIGAL